MAMQSAWLLSRRLIANQDDVAGRRRIFEIQREYASDWKAWFSMRVRFAAILANLAMRPGATARLLPFLARFPKILSVGALLSGKTWQIVAERSPVPRPARWPW
jgi:menaquinone-9 beta-reductase